MRAAEKSDALVAPPVAKAKAAILNGLAVPEVAEFRNISVKLARHQDGKLVRVVCGLVNTFSNGGYVGFQSFVYVLEPVQLVIVAADTPPDVKQTVTRLCG